MWHRRGINLVRTRWGEQFGLAIRALLFSAIVVSNFETAYGGPPAPEGSAAAVTQNIAADVAHLVGIRPDFTKFDCVAFDLWIRNNSENVVEIEFAEGDAGPEVILTKPDGARIVSRVSFRRHCTFFRWQRSVAPGEVGLTFRIDIEKLFGPLDLGRHQLSLRWPKGSLALATDERVVDGALETRELSFKIYDFRFEEIKTRLSRSNVVIERLSQEPSRGTKLGRGRITNNLKSKVAFYYDVASSQIRIDEKNGLLPSDMEGIRWAVKLPYPAWDPTQDRLTRPRDTNLRSFKVIAPGESVEIALPEWRCRENGAYFFSVPFYIIDESKLGSEALIPAGTTSSVAFLVKR